MRENSGLCSKNAIFKRIGGNKGTCIATINELLAEGLLTRDGEDGAFRVGGANGKARNMAQVVVERFRRRGE